MAINLGARKSNLPKVVSTFPSWNWTPGSALPVPYPVVYELNISENISKDVFYNGDNAFMMKSDSSHVTGDEAGINGGVISGTFSDKAEPIDHSLSVFINKREAVRCGDMFYMNNKNTIGTLICTPPPAKGAIRDSGKVAEAVKHRRCYRLWSSFDAVVYQKVSTTTCTV